MCGIFGFLKNNNCTTCSVVDIIFQGLIDLEIRGFDASGCALFQLLEYNNLIIRSKGPVINLENKYKKLDINQNYDYGIGHCRWKTHGSNSTRNAHPHQSSPKGTFIIVHNGIIENYLELKQFLQQSNDSIIFYSETDTEVIGHLLEYLYYLNKQYWDHSIGRLEDYVLQIIGKTMNLLVGTYGLIIHCSETPGILYAVKNGSSLIIGTSPDKGYFISSDLPSLRANYASQVLALEDQQIAVVYSDYHEIHKIIFSQEQSQEQATLDASLSESYSFQIPNVPFEEYQISNQIMKESKKKYKHHMLKEIFEQKHVITNTTGGRITIEKNNVETAIVKLGSFNDINTKITKLFLEEKKVQFLFLACGTSLHAGIFGKYLMEDFLGIPCSFESASEFLSKTSLIYKNTIVIALSQSGETADTIAAVKLAKSFQIETFGICNVVGSTLSRLVTSGIYTHAGIEQAVASTKAFIAQIVVLYILACYLKKHRSSVNNSYYYIQNKNNININQFLEFIKLELPSLVSIVLKQNKIIIQEIVLKYANTMKAILFIGKSYFYPIALECALKIKETSYIHADAYPAGELKHGPIALIDSNVIVVFFIPDEPLSASKIIHSVQEIKSRNGIVIVVISQSNLVKQENQIKLLADYIIQIPDVPYAISNYILPLLSVIPFQLFSYYLAVEKGLNVDRPRNLAKSVTVF